MRITTFPSLPLYSFRPSLRCQCQLGLGLAPDPLERSSAIPDRILRVLCLEHNEEGSLMALDTRGKVLKVNERACSVNHQYGNRRNNRGARTPNQLFLVPNLTINLVFKLDS